MPPQDAYLESQVLTADPMELVRLLYRAARDAVRSASVHLAAGRIAERSRQISKAHAILSQLSASLDRARAGALSRRLAELYDYMQRRLLEANLRQQAAPLEEVESLLATLLEGWDQVRSTTEHAVPPDSPGWPAKEDTGYGGYPPAFVPGCAAGYASQSWSL